MTLPAPNDAASLMAVISRAASDATVDPVKLTQLMDLYERIEARRSERAFSDAMNAAQAEMRAISQDASNPQTRSKYASYAALDNAIRPIYAKHGFALSFDTADGAAVDNVRVICKVSHRDGHSERPHLDMPNDGKGAKGGDVMTKTHATMSAVSYARRGLLKMVWNLSEGEFDDDGNGASIKPVCITPQQVAEIKALIETNGLSLPGFLTKLAKVETLEAIPAKDYQRLLNGIKARIAEKAAPVTTVAERPAGNGLFPEGEYSFEVAEAEDKTSAAGNEMLAIKLNVSTEDTAHGVYDYLVRTGKTAYKLRHFADAVGMLPDYEKGDLSADKVLGRTGKCKVAVQPEKDGYPAKNVVRDYVKRSTGDVAPPS